MACIMSLTECGMNSMLLRVSTLLNRALSTKSKREKDELICKALGSIDTMYYLIDFKDFQKDEAKPELEESKIKNE